MKAHELIAGKIYYNAKTEKEVEFRYIGGKGDAVCCEPGDSGGGMQSSFLVDPENLTPTGRRICSECGQEVKNR